MQASAAAEDPGASLQRHWQSLPANFKRDPGLLHTYVELLVDAGAAAAAEKVILRALKQQWDATLVDLYGRVEGDDPGKQLANAEHILESAHAALALCEEQESGKQQGSDKSHDSPEILHYGRRLIHSV